jgi:hypothetical protein
VQEAGANGVREATKKYMAYLLHLVLGIDVDRAEDLIRKRIRPDLAFVLISGNPKKQDAARIEWTTDYNISRWFDMWEEEMLELGFAVRTKGWVFEYTHPERIINIDETFLTLDEATQPGWAGRPVSVFYDPTGARTGRASNKSSITCTGLFGSTATGVALPPHFQVKSTGNDESKRISTSIAATVPSRFRWIDGSLHEPTFGCNEKGGMDAEEFMKKKMEAAATLTRASPGTERDLAKTWYENSSPGGRQRLVVLFANVRDELKGVEETSTDEDSV